MDKSTLFLISEPKIIETYWYSKLIKGINDQASKKGLNVSIIDKSKLEEMSSESSFGDDPIVIVSATIDWSDQIYNTLRMAGIRSILIGTGEQTIRRDTSIISLSQEDSTIDIIQYMVQAGRQRIAYFACNPRALTDKLKLSGFKTASDLMGLSFDEKDVFYNRGCIDDCLQQFYKSMHKYDGVMCANDVSAIALIRFAELKGIRIPEDMYVVGFGNTIIGRFINPSLTSATLNYYDVGCHAVDNYIYLSKHPKISSQFTIIKCQIIVRASTEYKEAEIYSTPILRQYKHKLHKSDDESFYTDQYVTSILKFEEFFQNLDNLDKNILRGISEGKTYEMLSEYLNISESALKYHVKKMLQVTDSSTRQELLSVISELFGSDALNSFLNLDENQNYTII